MMLGRTWFLVAALAIGSVACTSKAPSSSPGTKSGKNGSNVPGEGDTSSKGGGSSSSSTPPPSGADTGTNAPSSPVSPASPKLDSMSPTSAQASAAEAAQVDVTLSGANFASDANVSVGGQSVKPTSAASTQIVVRLPASVVAQAGSVPIKVLNPPKEGGASNSLAFTVTSAAAAVKLAAIDPTSAEAGATSAVSLDVTGSGFTTTSKVRFNGGDVKTAFVSATELTATVPTTMLKIPGSVSVTVHDAAGTVVSSPQTFTIMKATAASTCDYACADYGYSTGQCFEDWTCGNDGCLTQQACTQPTTCEYKCADYNYTAGQCFEDWTCGDDGCLTQKACDASSGSSSSSSGGSSSGGASACDYACADYGYADGECSAGWCCDPATECLVDESQYYGP